jgi:hypothetical protein
MVMMMMMMMMTMPWLQCGEGGAATQGGEGEELLKPILTTPEQIGGYDKVRRRPTGGKGGREGKGGGEGRGSGEKREDGEEREAAGWAFCDGPWWCRGARGCAGDSEQ